jgi:hypothetical protein
VLPFAARCTGGSVAQGAAGAMLQTEIVFEGATGPLQSFVFFAAMDRPFGRPNRKFSIMEILYHQISFASPCAESEICVKSFWGVVPTQPANVTSGVGT